MSRQEPLPGFRAALPPAVIVPARPDTAALGPIAAPGPITAFLGVDPGLGGGVALLEPDGTLVSCWDMPAIELERGRDYDRAACWAMLRAAQGVYPGVWIVLEQLTPFPTQKGSSATTNFRLGIGGELWHMAAVGIGAPLELVRPQRWQKGLGVASGEEASLARARELFPRAELHLKKHSGRAAALLIAEWGRRTLQRG